MRDKFCYSYFTRGWNHTNPDSPKLLQKQGIKCGIFTEIPQICWGSDSGVFLMDSRRVYSIEFRLERLKRARARREEPVANDEEVGTAP